MLKTIVTVIAVAAALAAAALVPVWQIHEIQNDPIAVLVSTYLPFLSVILIGYVLFNILSGVMRHGDVTTGSSVLYWLDYIASLIATLSFTATLIWVLLAGFGGAEGYPQISSVKNVPASLWVLIGITIFSWFDVRFLQRGKHSVAVQRIRTEQAIAPAPVVVTTPAPALAPAVAGAPAPALAPAPATTVVARPTDHGWPIFVLGVLALLVLLYALFANGDKVKLGDLLDLKKGVADSSGMCNSTNSSVVETGRGTLVYMTGC